MFGTNKKVIVQEQEYRPCWVNGKKALFHRWINTAKPQAAYGQKITENTRYYQFRSTRGLVEYEDGTVAADLPQEIQFADGGLFHEYAWLPRKEEAQ